MLSLNSTQPLNIPSYMMASSIYVGSGGFIADGIFIDDVSGNESAHMASSTATSAKKTVTLAI